MNLLCCCTMAPNTKVTRKWELFAGRNRFYCDGLLMSAPHTGVFYLTCFLITGTSILFFVFDCPYLATRITPAIPIVGAILYFFTMSSLLRTTFTDPGVIPRASHDEAAYIEKQIEVPNSLNSPTYRPPPRTKEVLVKGQTVKLKYCFTCKIFRPPRASHCSLCDNCVDRFDHHCPWVGNCVGKRNYRFFYMFLVSLAFLAVFIFSCSITHLVLVMKIEQEVFEVIKKAPFSVIVTFICFFSIWSVIGLAGFHTYLTTSDQTTNEDLKGSFSSKGGQRAVNPYSRGNICLNCFHILCGPMTPSLIDRRGIVTDEYILQMQHSNQNQNNQLTDVTTTPSGLITNQPIIGAVDAISTKQRLYDENIPPTGIYRHRSYDNLQNGNSNSLAHLVDNEIPLSTIEGPVQTPIDENCQLKISPMNNGIHDNDDDDNIEKINNNKRLNNLSGSYNNLFRDNLDDNNYCEHNDDVEIKYKKQQQFQQQHQQQNVHQIQTQISNLNKSTSDSENVYSNIINSNISSSALGNNVKNRSDPNLHVYSNLIEEQQQQHQQQLQLQHPQQQQQQQQHPQFQHNLKDSLITTTTILNTTNKANDISSSSDKLINNKHIKGITLNNNSSSNNSGSNNHNERQDNDSMIIHDITTMDDMMLSTLLSDDLDLDDPVSAFVVNNRKKHASTRKVKTSTAQKNSQSSDNERDKTINGNDMLTSSQSNPNIAPGIMTMSGQSTTISSPNNTLSTSTSNIRDTTTTNFITPSRLRLLHDTTMIDTALDLDSLDGSSIGNNSQACLVKTAMV